MSDGTDATLFDADSDAPASVPVPAAELGDRYELGGVLGRGGMGEIRLARDVRIHREVAVKLMRAGTRDEAMVGRFFREARVQGVLEHPSVVPVHDLGIDEAGNPYFVMKRLTGTTLADVLASSDADVRARWPQRQLLARLVDVCLAIEFAHTRGVIHRDLKPANLMLGDFGEAYVLDWGIARITDARDDAASVEPRAGAAPGHTAAGDLLGTPGYMSPEQARGDHIDARADVYALGCVLFELLTGTPALPRGLEGLAAALDSAEHRPSTRGGEVPPELDDLCARATRASPAARPSARELADGIQAYLDGDRDVARRRELAHDAVLAARRALVRGGDDARAEAMREAGRALALDAENATAQDVLASLLVAVPETIPAGALAAADEERATHRQSVARWAARGYLGYLAMLALMLALPLHSSGAVIAELVLTLVAWAVLRRISMRPLPSRSGWYVALLVISSAMLVLGGAMFGPLLIVPLFVIGAIAGFLAPPTDFHWSVIVATFVVPIVAMVGLELAGVTPRTFDVVGGSLVLTAPVLDLTSLSALILIAGSSLIQVVNTTIIVLSARRSTEWSQNQVHAQRWHLQQLLPAAPDAAPVPGIEPPGRATTG